MRGWHLAAMIFGFVSFLLLLIALGSHSWLEMNKVTIGLWEACFHNPSIELVGCFPMETVQDYIHATRAFLILAALAGLITCVLLCLLCSRSEIGSYSVAKIAWISSYAAGIFVLIAMAVFTGRTQALKGPFLTDFAYKWSFGLGWACAPLFLANGAVTQKAQA